MRKPQPQHPLVREARFFAAHQANMQSSDAMESRRSGKDGCNPSGFRVHKQVRRSRAENEMQAVWPFLRPPWSLFCSPNSNAVLFLSHKCPTLSPSTVGGPPLRPDRGLQCFKPDGSTVAQVFLAPFTSWTTVSYYNPGSQHFCLPKNASSQKRISHCREGHNLTTCCPVHRKVRFMMDFKKAMVLAVFRQKR